MVRAAILDDYQNVALKLADWSPSPDVEIKVFDKPFASEAEAIKACRTSPSWSACASAFRFRAR